MTNTDTATTRMFGRCMAKGCRTSLVIEVTAVAGVITLDDRIRMATEERNILFATCCSGQTNRGDHGLKWTGLKGHFDQSIKCTARCAKGTGYECNCECGGENHGTAAMH